MENCLWKAQQAYTHTHTHTHTHVLTTHPTFEVPAGCRFGCYQTFREPREMYNMLNPTFPWKCHEEIAFGPLYCWLCCWLVSVRGKDSVPGRRQGLANEILAGRVDGCCWHRSLLGAEVLPIWHTSSGPLWASATPQECPLLHRLLSLPNPS